METADIYHERIGILLDFCGRPDICTGPHCGVSIWWLKSKNGAPTPFTREGLNHFVNCPDAAQFKGPR